MIACEVWLRRDYLLRHGIRPDEPECGCDDCPPEQALDALDQALETQKGQP
jgi:hypothetical protein